MITDKPIQINIRLATQDDAATVLSLITALAEFEHLEGPGDGSLERYVEHGFGPNPKFEAWLAEVPDLDNKPVGYALLYYTFSTFLVKPGLFLEDLFVLPEYRKLGIGKALLRHCVQLASHRGCGRLEWTCLDWNTNAQSVYESIGARKMQEWLLYRMTQDTMEKYLDR